MVLNQFEWSVVVAFVGVLFGIAGFFVKGLTTKPQKHEDAINKIEKTFATKEDLKEHSKDIDLIKQTYVKREELDIAIKDVRQEMLKKTEKLASDVGEIKDNYLPKSDFYRAQAGTDKKLDDIYNLLLRQKGE